MKTNRLPDLGMLPCLRLFAAGVTMAFLANAADNPNPPWADRAAVERVQYNHRLGTKPPFEQALPIKALQNLVRLDARKESTLRRVYNIEVAPARVEAELQRIDRTSRAPDVLAELKAALGNDSARFARTFVRPIVVDRLLRQRFLDDDDLHAPLRRQAERAREELLTAKRGGAACDRLVALLHGTHSNAVSETTWHLGARPVRTEVPGSELAEVQGRFGPHAQLLSPPPSEEDRKDYFEDLPADLQNVLRIQLIRPGDVSAVIEMPGGFLLYVARERTDARLMVATLSLPKRNYEQWIAEQNGDVQ